MKNLKILIAEDEKDLRRLLYDQLTGEGYEVIEAGDGKRALDLFNSEKPDMAILDIMMPVTDGLSVLSKIRESSEMPVIMLTARGDEIDKVSGLRLGADDYLVKPWGMNELLARIEVQKRHLKLDEEKKEVLVSGNLLMDFTNGVIEKDGKAITLNAKEFNILKFFAENCGKVLTKKQIYQEAWQDEYMYDDNTIMVQISHLRSKIDDEENRHIETLIGIGYRFN
ncbi:MAG: response regulator transcription factor [Lachnospiraceae bacterium]|nr:response regulator transcription factor [Lachnospiraceae bacterium]